MKRWLTALAIVAWSCAAQALSPYVEAGRLPAAGPRAAMTEAGMKLTGAGFSVIGRYEPRGLPKYGVVVATDAGLLGADNIAALPWEIYVVDNRAYALYGRYRIALGWPELGLGQFMTIVRHPDTTMEAPQAVVGKRR